MQVNVKSIYITGEGELDEFRMDCTEECIVKMHIKIRLFTSRNLIPMLSLDLILTTK